MYDFYKNPPNSKKDLRDWLTSWLEKPNSESSVLEYNGEQFNQEYGFRLGFHAHTVFKSLSTKEYVWWVIPDEKVGTTDTFPNIRFPDFETMLNNIIDDYYIKWKLND